MIEQERIERVAKAIANVFDSDTGESWTVFQTQFRQAARAALGADAPALAAAEARGKMEGLKSYRDILVKSLRTFGGDYALLTALDQLIASLQSSQDKTGSEG